jgi:hypothetical protein
MKPQLIRLVKVTQTPDSNPTPRIPAVGGSAWDQKAEIKHPLLSRLGRIISANRTLHPYLQQRIDFTKSPSPVTEWLTSFLEDQPQP